MRSARLYHGIVRQFLTKKFGSKPIKLSNITRYDLQNFVRAESKRRIRSIRSVVSALRSFVQYLWSKKKIKNNLRNGLLPVRFYRLSNIPKYLTSIQVKRILFSCDRRTSVGRRDYAILTLLACLGLRAEEVASLQMNDIDWINSTIIVNGKNNTVRVLPLTSDVGSAISKYIQQDRYIKKRGPVFNNVRAPHSRLTGYAVYGIVHRAIERADVNTPTKGPHQFRHTLATKMLANGASLAQIGEILRHQSPETTLIYAKVDFSSLRLIARPWPRGC